MISRTDRSAVTVVFCCALAWPLSLASVALTGCGGDKAPPAESSNAIVAGPLVPASATPPEPAGSGSAAPSAPAETPLARLAWLQGKWTGASPDGAQIEETWSPPDPPGSVMKGASKTTKGGKQVASETLAIEVRPDAYVYVAEPSGQKKTEFIMKDKASTGTTVLFVNLEHDWPTQIRYERAGDDLKVKIQGRPGQQVVEYTLKLTK
jgi:hypothetical protein